MPYLRSRHSSAIPLLPLLAIFLTSFAQSSFSQAPATSPRQIESTQDLTARMTPDQKQQSDQAMNAFHQQRYPDALAMFKQLLQQIEGDAVLSKFASEAALNTGDLTFALNLLKPLASANPDDWRAAALLTRGCAESGDTTCRDSGIAHMLDLHRRGITPPGMQQYVLERIKLGENTILIRTSVEPWGPYKIYDLAQVFNNEGKIFLRITIESSDFDQSFFADQHPKEASQGLRSFSLDAYRETGLTPDGKRTQTHYTFKMFVGQPPYETIRQAFIDIATGKSHPMTSRTHLVVP